MSNADKILEKMRNNPHGWRIESLKVIARAHAILKSASFASTLSSLF